ncbi:MAG: histidine phosphatase family protein [Burkholderiales bacterium]|nr:histidine phosphatase family protein [Burkholderiales bacterium]
MELILWRHAEAEDGLPDRERALTRRGRKQARAVAKWLARRLPERCTVLVSPTVRAQQTAAALARKRVTAAEVDVGASARRVLARTGWPDARGAVLVVGHQPTLGRIAARVLAGSEADWSIRKGAVWWIARRDGEVVLRAAIDPDLV